MNPIVNHHLRWNIWIGFLSLNDLNGIPLVETQLCKMCVFVCELCVCTCVCVRVCVCVYYVPTYSQAAVPGEGGGWWYRVAQVSNKCAMNSKRGSPQYIYSSVWTPPPPNHPIGIRTREFVVLVWDELINLLAVCNSVLQPSWHSLHTEAAWPINQSEHLKCSLPSAICVLQHPRGVCHCTKSMHESWTFAKLVSNRHLDTSFRFPTGICDWLCTDWLYKFKTPTGSIPVGVLNL